ncbi:hypothetical protein [Flexivirga caeni]|uniref:DUF1795 domain-containing protein n=1 Tax=Flexivirga caeni TaxID=2294115 RepID=A0A3M9M1K9_9MICO|nr:hypothetical protein [Flexivirga caeni]RNI19451.1 hypothetical protein EFY87_16560 [Flexivirga caeni]
MGAASTTRLIRLGAAAVLVTGLAACSSHTSASPTPSSSISVPTTVTGSPTPTPSTSAAAGSVESKDKTFSVVAPTGWKKFSDAQATLSVKAPAATDKVTTNFNVVVQHPTTVPSVDDVVSQAEIAWRQQGVRATDEPDRTIGGLPSRGYTFTRTAQGTQFRQTQYFVVFREHVYSMTMTSAATPGAQSAADQALTAILSTWAWRKV